ncbi:stage II sporulation protein M [Dethiobacter alkaliphilus]|uniref:Stage II sporulation protein M n=1 Tax=Dethiobacter alkaliphilus AHT 1 TaxID=555088 RepID=C0GFK9_DETAL|nr:stage II sporulation protein M [Dethiobacter alkaliphilus]EEG77969.1 protein of unknown function DUF95 transmembrane [Dethiobacter alkaliphilus AHT 1]
MNSEVFLASNRKTWERLNLILDKIAQNGPAALSQEDIKALGPLFRRVTAHLAYANTHFPGHEMNEYLNKLVVKAHAHIYKKETMGMYRLMRFFSTEFPSLVAIHWQMITAAGIILIFGLLSGYLLNYYQPSLNSLIVPEQMQTLIGEDLARGNVGADWPVAERPAISSMIMVNNIQVGFLSFALGFTWGLGTVYVMLYNGLLVGVLGAIFTSAGFGLEFWTLILPHGALELAAIFICGGAGLVLAKALVKPGDYLRKDALLIQGKIAMKLVLGTIPMFVIAALIEGFITPSNLPGAAKLLVAVLSMLLFFLYLYTGIRKNRNIIKQEATSATRI